MRWYHKQMKKNFQNNKGLTLVELIFSVAILVPVVAGALKAYISVMELNAYTEHQSLIVQDQMNKIEEIKYQDSTTIKAVYNQKPFPVSTALKGMGVSYVDDSNPSLLVITLVCAWEEKNGKIIGEDTNLNGLLDQGEDVNSDGILNSPSILMTQISRNL